MASRARIAMRGQEHDVPVLNLSRRGAMVAAEIGAREGERIAIQFPECNPLHGVIRWAGEGRIGIEFAQQTALLIPANWRLVSGRRNGEAPTEAVQRPRPPRHKLLWECELYWGRGADRVRLRNISADGAMLDGSKNVPVGTEVVLALRSAGTVNGSVKWCRAGQIGLKFDRSFDIRKLMAPGVVAEPSSSARPGVLKPLYLQTELDPDSPWAARSEKLKPRDFD